MWNHIFNKNLCTILFVHILAVVLLCGCSGNEELYLLDVSEELSGQAEEPSGSGVCEDAAADEDAGQVVICVHVCGAVAAPGVVQIPAGSRAQAAVAAAGGFTEAADTAFVNLAAIIKDGEQLYIPTKEEAERIRRNQAALENGIVNLNTADVSLLCTLPGIGESRAEDIIAYRLEYGGFADTKEIMQVPGIKESTYEKIKNLITVN